VRLVIKLAARADMLRQVGYYSSIGRDDVANRFLDRVRTSIEAIARMPLAGAPKHFDSVALAGMRSRSVDAFDVIRIYYLVSDEAVTILRILHGRRDIDGILGEDDA
jgi:plasmid stabilization system protein ParE